jgi:hypothetical protein
MKRWRDGGMERWGKAWLDWIVLGLGVDRYLCLPEREKREQRQTTTMIHVTMYIIKIDGDDDDDDDDVIK